MNCMHLLLGKNKFLGGYILRGALKLLLRRRIYIKRSIEAPKNKFLGDKIYGKSW